MSLLPGIMLFAGAPVWAQGAATPAPRVEQRREATREHSGRDRQWTEARCQVQSDPENPWTTGIATGARWEDIRVHQDSNYSAVQSGGTCIVQMEEANGGGSREFRVSSGSPLVARPAPCVSETIGGDGLPTFGLATEVGGRRGEAVVPASEQACARFGRYVASTSYRSRVRRARARTVTDRRHLERDRRRNAGSTDAFRGLSDKQYREQFEGIDRPVSDLSDGSSGTSEPEAVVPASQ